MPPEKVAVRNASDARQVKDAKLNEKVRYENLLNDVRAVMRIPEGRRLMWQLLAQTNVFDSIFVTSSEIYYRAGQQDIGHWIMKLIDKADPKLYLQMQQEAAKIEENKIEPETTPEE